MKLRRVGFFIAGALIVPICLGWYFFQMPSIVHEDLETNNYHRIVSLAPSFTKTLVALNEGKRLVGVTAHCPKVFDTNPNVVGTFANPSLETILSLHPDLVLLTKHPRTQSIASALSNTRVKIYAHEAESLADIFSINIDIAALLNTPAFGHALNEKMVQSIDQARMDLKKYSGATFLIFFGHHPLVAASPATYPGEILERLGLKNIMTQNNPKWPIWPLEKLLTSPPDFILIAEGKDVWPIYEKIFRDIWPQRKGPAILVPKKPVLISPAVNMVEDLPHIVESFKESIR